MVLIYTPGAVEKRRDVPRTPAVAESAACLRLQDAPAILPHHRSSDVHTSQSVRVRSFVLKRYSLFFSRPMSGTLTAKATTIAEADQAAGVGDESGFFNIRRRIQARIMVVQ